MYMNKKTRAVAEALIEAHQLESKVLTLYQPGEGGHGGAVIIRIADGEISGFKCIPMTQIEFTERFQNVVAEMVAEGRNPEVVRDDRFDNKGGVH